MEDDKYLDMFRKLASEMKEGDGEKELEDRIREAEKDPARLVAGYVILDRLGEGAGGVVFRAWHRDLQRHCALKFLGPEDDRSRRRFLREARAAARLRHPGIVTVHEVGEHEGRPFIAMECVEGPALDKVKWKPREAVEAIRLAAEAIHHAHEEGVIHRDLKPANILVGPDGRPRVTDFGLARFQKAGETVTLPGAVAGTPVFLAPEAVKFRRPSVATDIYGLGATLYALLAGNPPYSGTTLAEIVHKVATEDPVPLRRRCPTLHREIVLIVEKAMAREPERRYASARALAEDLGRHLRGEAVEARPPSAFYLLRKWAVRRKLHVLAGAALLAAAVILPWWLAAERKAGEAEEKRGKAEEEAREADERARVAEVQRRADRLFLEVDEQLKLLRRNFYLQDFRLTEEVFGEFAGLERRVRDFMEEVGESARGWGFIGRCRHVIADVPGAERAYGRALELTPGHLESLIGQGLLLMDRTIRAATESQGWLEGEDTIAVRGVREAQEAAVRLRAELKKTEEDEKSDRLDVDLAKGYLLLFWGPETLPGYCDRMVRKWETKPFVEEFLLLKGIALGTAEARQEYAAEVISRQASHFRAHHVLSTALRGSDVERAVEESTRAIRINPRFAPAYRFRAARRFAGEDRTGAFEDIGRAIELDPGYGEYRFSRGAMRMINAYDLESAIEDFTEVIGLHPKFWPAYHRRGACHLNLGREARDATHYDRALEDFDRAIDLNHGCYEAFLGRASIHEQRGEREPLIRDLERALETAPEDWSKRKLVEFMLRRHKGGH